MTSRGNGANMEVIFKDYINHILS